MSLSSFLFRVIILALPGITASLLYRKLRGKPNQKDWEDFIDIWFFSLVSYCLYGFSVNVINWIFGSSLTLSVLQSLFDEKSPLSWKEVAAVSILSIVVAFVASYINSHKLINKIGQRLSVTARYDDADVWECFNDEFKSKWVYVRDHKLNLLYYGWINLYSDSEKPRELLLIDAQVYNNLSGEYLYSCEMLYIARERSELSIEIPKVGSKSSGSNGKILNSRKDDANATRSIEQR
ncbi:MAG: hypothetical protein ACREBD_36955, partial [Blastocatellia bacterium]